MKTEPPRKDSQEACVILTRNISTSRKPLKLRFFAPVPKKSEKRQKGKAQMVFLTKLAAKLGKSSR
jgi:hypothetical protein